MNLKNWYVQSQPTKKGEKGFKRRVDYLHNKNEPSHAQTNIVPLGNTAVKAANILNEIELNRQNRKRTGKSGGGLSVYSQEFCFALPTLSGQVPNPTKKQWSLIYLDLVKELAKQLSQKRIKKESEIKYYEQKVYLYNNDLKKFEEIDSVKVKKQVRLRVSFI